MFECFLSFFTRTLSWSTAMQGLLDGGPSTAISDISPQNAIPGGSPLNFCNVSSEKDLYNITYIEAYPQPLHVDDLFQVHMYGTFLKNITENATLALTVQYENYTDGRETAYLKFCDGVDSLDQLGRPHGEPECPPKKGWGLMMITGWVWPMFIYEGSWYFRFDAQTEDEERIYCLDAHVKIKRKRSTSE